MATRRLAEPRPVGGLSGRDHSWCRRVPADLGHGAGFVALTPVNRLQTYGIRTAHQELSHGIGDPPSVGATPRNRALPNAASSLRMPPADAQA
jgi:hypothetical protein